MNKPICPPISPEKKEREAQWTWNQSRTCLLLMAMISKYSYYNTFPTASNFILNNQKSEEKLTNLT